MKRILSAFLFVLTVAGCREDINSLPPVIILEKQSYDIPAGTPVTISPEYENCTQNTVYLWTCNGQTVSTEPSLTFSSDAAGIFYFLLTVDNGAGEDKAEVQVNVLGQTPPRISFPEAAGGFTVLRDSALILAPETTSSLPVTYSWSINGQEVSTEASLAFPTSETGEFEVVFRAENRDGADFIKFGVKVADPSDAFSWTFASDSIGLSSGRSALITPTDITYPFDAVYTWSIDGMQVQSSESPGFVFDLVGTGEYAVRVTMTNSYTEASHDIAVRVYPPEGTFRRPAGPESSPLISVIFEYTPAPGQFINENCTAATPEEACDYAMKRLSGGEFVSLGAFGGYITAGFDHSVESGGNGIPDLQITGNAHSSSSEPGIIWVSQDVNNNGIPDDIWYELRGSEYGKPETWQDYAVTYYRPEGPGMSVDWTDNRGGSGTVDYLPAYHDQDCYYPAWIERDSYTLRGTRLQSRLADESGNGSLWVGHPFDWGYADNWSATDPDIDKFSISDAVCWDGTPAELEYIDFVKIQCGVQAKGGWTGEQSTEITLIRDLHL